MTRAEVIKKIDIELLKSVEKHGPLPESYESSTLIMLEEAGEVTKAVVEYTFFRGPKLQIEKELISTAAMCVKMLRQFF